jgi:tetratricopeptide (TPR) repeat protein
MAENTVKPSGSTENKISGFIAGSVVQAGNLTLYGNSELLSATPYGLPHDIDHFTGRSIELAFLDSLLQGGATNVPRIGVIVGMPSVGKTGLATYWSHSQRHNFSAGHLYIDLNGFGIGRQASPNRVLADFLLTLGIPSTRIPASTEGKAGLFRSVTFGRQMLIVLDNAASYEQVRPLLPGCASCTVIVTSRLRMSHLVANDGASQLILRPLDQDISLELLASFIGRDRVTAESESARRIAARAKGLPLAIRTYGNIIAQRPDALLADVVKEMSQIDLLDSLESGEDDVRDARRSFTWSYRKLDNATADVLRHLGLHPGPTATVTVASVLTDQTADISRKCLRALVAANLIDEPTQSRYRLHDFLRDFAEERARDEMSEEERVSAERRMLAWYLYSADAADARIAPQRKRLSLHPIPRPAQTMNFVERSTAVAWCDTELSNLVDATERAAVRGENEITWRFAAVLWNYFYLRKPFEEWHRMCELGLHSAELLRDPAAEQSMCNGIASAYRHQRRFSDAVQYYERALSLRDNALDPWDESWLLNNLAESLRGIGQYPRARDLYDRAIAISRSIDDSWSRGCFLTNLGEAFAELGQYQDAIASYEAALPLRRAHNHVYGEGWTYNDLGESYQALGRLDDAMTAYTRSLDLRTTVDDRFGEAWTLHNIGRVLDSIHRQSEARVAFERALNLRRIAGDRWGAACSADELAEIFDRQGDINAARALRQEALVVFDELDTRRAAIVQQKLNDR